GMPIHLRKAIVRINGTDAVESVTMVDVTSDGEVIPGTKTDIAVDFVCIAGGLYPLAELAAATGLPFQFREELGGHIPIHTTGIESAKVARAQGKVAGLSIINNQGKEKVASKLQSAMEEVNQIRHDASIQFHPNIEYGRKKVAEAFAAATK